MLKDLRANEIPNNDPNQNNHNWNKNQIKTNTEIRQKRENYLRDLKDDINGLNHPSFYKLRPKLSPPSKNIDKHRELFEIKKSLKAENNPYSNEAVMAYRLKKGVTDFDQERKKVKAFKNEFEQKIKNNLKDADDVFINQNYPSNFYLLPAGLPVKRQKLKLNFSKNEFFKTKRIENQQKKSRDENSGREAGFRVRTSRKRDTSRRRRNWKSFEAYVSPSKEKNLVKINLIKRQKKNIYKIKQL